MADAKLTALTAASALSAADLFYVSQSAASRKATGTQLLALVGTAYVPLAGGTMTGALTLPAGTAGAPSLSFTTGGADTGFYAAAAGEFHAVVSGASKLWFTGGGVYATGAVLGVYQNASYLAFGTSLDIKVYRDAAGSLAQRNGTAQQSFSVYNTYTDSSNYERLKLTGVAGTSVNIKAETLGTGGDNLDIVLTPAGTGGVVKVTDGGSNYRDLKLRNLLAGGGNGSYVQTPSMTVDRLADAATAGAGARAFVTDANATTFLSTVAAGGSNKVPVVSDGTNWLIG